jgi:glycerol-3-phosphate dehydrogenase
MWICRNEMPVTVADILARRTRALILDARASSAIAPVVAGIMALEMEHDNKWQEKQIREYNELVLRYI